MKLTLSLSDPTAHDLIRELSAELEIHQCPPNPAELQQIEDTLEALANALRICQAAMGLPPS